MSLHQLMAQHAAQIVQGEHADEVATYHFADGSPDRSVRVIMSREVAADLGGDPADTATIQEATAFLANNATIGITTWSNGDEITVPIRYGQPPVRCRIVEELSSGPMGFVLRIAS